MTRKTQSLDQAHLARAEPGRRDGEHFRRAVHSRDVRGVAEKLAGPHAGAAGQFEHASGGPERLERFGQFVTAQKIEALVDYRNGLTAA
jgi:hypothetical protein